MCRILSQSQLLSTSPTRFSTRITRKRQRFLRLNRLRVLNMSSMLSTSRMSSLKSLCLRKNRRFTRFVHRNATSSSASLMAWCKLKACSKSCLTAMVSCVRPTTTTSTPLTTSTCHSHKSSCLASRPAIPSSE